MPVAKTSKEASATRKAAVVIVSLLSDQAAKIYRYLRDDEVEQLTLEIANLDQISSDNAETILNEFYELCFAQKVLTEGGLEHAKSILEKAFGNQVAMQLLERMTKSLNSRAFEFVRKADPKLLMSIIQNEHPQTIALILSYTTQRQASAVLSELPKDKQIDVAERIARMDRTSPEIIKEVERILERKFSNIATMDFMEIGGLNYIAEILNSVDRSTEKFILDELFKKNPVLADQIRAKMFVFEDIINLDNTYIQKSLREIDTKDLVVALKSANQEVVDVILSNVSERMRTTITEEMSMMTHVRLKDVEQAQQRIVAVIRRLEEQGEIVVSRGGEDEMV